MALCRTGFSPNIKERRDYSCAIYDALGRDHGPGRPHPSAPRGDAAVRACGDRVDRMRPGDMVMLNDPYPGRHAPAGHHAGHACVRGRRRRPSFYVANRAHHADVGGMSPGSMPLARELFQEGLLIPPVVIVRRGELVRDVLSLLLANVRTPVEREGDLTAQIAANRIGERRLLAAVARHGRHAVERYAAAAQDYTERVLRRTIREIPDGVYRYEDALEDDGFGHGPIPIRVAIHVGGDQACVDFTGSSPQVEGGVNANYAMTLSATLYAFRCLVQDDVLYNAGIARPIRVIAPDGSIVNAVAAVRGRRRQRRNVAAHHRRGAGRARAGVAGAHARGEPGNHEQRHARRRGPADGAPVRLLRDAGRRHGRQAGSRRAECRARSHEQHPEHARRGAGTRLPVRVREYLFGAAAVGRGSSPVATVSCVRWSCWPTRR